MTASVLSRKSPASARADAVVVGLVPSGDDPGPTLAPGAEDLVKASRRAKRGLVESLAVVRAGTKVGAVTRIPAPAGLAADTVVAVGLGAWSDDSAGLDTLRAAAATAVRSLAGTGTVVVALPAATPEQVAAVTLGAELGAYTFDRYRTTPRAEAAPVGQVTVTSDRAGDRATKAAFARAQQVAAGVRLARDLVNTAPSDQSPAGLADAAVRTGKDHGLKVQVLDEKALAKGGYGGLVGVGQGSVNPPRLIRVAYTHPRAKKTLALCGKGITFDSGGLSLKTNDGMAAMKCDMGGAAAVLGTLVAVSRIKPKVNVVGYLACAENMPSGSAQRPSDVLTTYGGTTVEVLNTDAEGRLVLADALARAVEDEPDILVDIATLTGAQMVALGHRYFAVLGDDETRAAVVAAADRAGEPAWPMPLPPDGREHLSSDVADIANVARHRHAGMLLAGVFLKAFVPDGQAWVHLDIAGPAFSDKADGYTSKGGTGVTVRTMVELAESLAG
ncbi:MAG: leucyl aminopeptidase [Streptosporangiales bacterium]|nr:leucyl aminopeptidase [Streptosporangiales bacterium]